MWALFGNSFKSFARVDPACWMVAEQCFWSSQQHWDCSFVSALLLLWHCWLLLFLIYSPVNDDALRLSKDTPDRRWLTILLAALHTIIEPEARKDLLYLFPFNRHAILVYVTVRFLFTVCCYTKVTSAGVSFSNMSVTEHVVVKSWISSPWTDVTRNVTLSSSTR